MLAYLYPVQHRNHPDCVIHYESFENEKVMTGIQYPVALNDISKFEKLNNISVNVFVINKQGLIIPVRITENKHMHMHVNLLYLSNYGNNHYVLIRDMSRLLAGQINKRQNAKYICDYCLHGCTTAEILC